MKIILTLMIVGFFCSFRIPPKEFVCLPCGRDCDGQVFDKDGKCPSCGMTLVDKSTVHFKNVSVDGLCTRIETNPEAIVLDVRSAAEFDGSSKDVETFGHFKKAININVDELESRVKEVEKYKEKEVLVYCSHAHRSAVASYFLGTHGFTNVKNMLGGVSTIHPQNNRCLTKSFVVHHR